MSLSFTSYDTINSIRLCTSFHNFAVKFPYAAPSNARTIHLNLLYCGSQIVVGSVSLVVSDVNSLRRKSFRAQQFVRSKFGHFSLERRKTNGRTENGSCLLRCKLKIYLRPGRISQTETLRYTWYDIAARCPDSFTTHSHCWIGDSHGNAFDIQIYAHMSCFHARALYAMATHNFQAIGRCHSQWTWFSCLADNLRLLVWATMKLHRSPAQAKKLILADSSVHARWACLTFKHTIPEYDLTAVHLNSVAVLVILWFTWNTERIFTSRICCVVKSTDKQSGVATSRAQPVECATITHVLSAKWLFTI